MLCHCTTKLFLGTNTKVESESPQIQEKIFTLKAQRASTKKSTAPPKLAQKAVSLSQAAAYLKRTDRHGSANWRSVARHEHKVLGIKIATFNISALKFTSEPVKRQYWQVSGVHWCKQQCKMSRLCSISVWPSRVEMNIL